MVGLLAKLYYFHAFRRFKSYGSNVRLSRGGVFVHPEEIQLGSNVFISRGFHISARSLSIGNNVIIGPNLTIECDDHVVNTVGKTMFETQNERKLSNVTINDDVWIGANVVILKGVTVNEGAVVGAGSIVTKSIPPYSISVGNPCRVIKTRFTEQELREHIKSVKSKYAAEDVFMFWKEHGLI